MIRGFLMAAVTSLATPVLSSGAAAQERQAEPEILPGIPTSALPPEGMCRVWLRDVPVGRQPAPTDCASAIKTRPRDAMLLIGDQGKAPRGPARSSVNAIPQPPRFANPAFSGPRAARPAQSLTPATASAPAAAPASTPAAGMTAVKAPDSKAAVVARPPE